MSALPWLEDLAAGFSGMLRRDQVPQSLMIHGLPGTGRRLLALWMAEQLLGKPAGLSPHLDSRVTIDQLLDTSVSPDLLTIRPAPDKQGIPVEAIRELVTFLHLSSHQGGERVAIVWPAETMTLAAANALLKTLEEPPRKSTIVLVTAEPARLPATIVSRCHRLRVPRPARDTALEWLRTQSDGQDWADLLEYAAGAPLEALALAQSGLAGQLRCWAKDFNSLRQSRDNPVTVARRWAGNDCYQAIIRWLYVQAVADVRKQLLNPSALAATAHLKNTANQTSMAALERLRELEGFLGVRPHGLSEELQIAALLQRWYGDSRDERR